MPLSFKVVTDLIQMEENSEPVKVDFLQVYEDGDLIAHSSVDEQLVLEILDASKSCTSSLMQNRTLLAGLNFPKAVAI